MIKAYVYEIASNKLVIEAHAENAKTIRDWYGEMFYSGECALSFKNIGDMPQHDEFEIINL